MPLIISDLRIENFDFSKQSIINLAEFVAPANYDELFEMLERVQTQTLIGNFYAWSNNGNIENGWNVFTRFQNHFQSLSIRRRECQVSFMTERSSN